MKRAGALLISVGLIGPSWVHQEATPSDTTVQAKSTTVRWTSSFMIAKGGRFVI